MHSADGVESKNNEILESDTNPHPSTFKILVEPLVDMYGPSITYPGLECLVLSKEVEKGGGMVNDEREKAGFSRIPVFVCPLLITPSVIPVDDVTELGKKVHELVEDDVVIDLATTIQKSIVDDVDSSTNSITNNAMFFFPTSNPQFKVSSTDFRHLYQMLDKNKHDVSK